MVILIIQLNLEIKQLWNVITSISGPPTHLTAGSSLFKRRWLASSSNPHWQIARVAPASLTYTRNKLITNITVNILMIKFVIGSCMLTRYDSSDWKLRNFTEAKSIKLSTHFMEIKYVKSLIPQASQSALFFIGIKIYFFPTD